MALNRSKDIFPTAPTHTKFVRGAASPQVQAAAQLSANYYSSSAWRSNYEWQKDDELAQAKLEQDARKSSQLPPPPAGYSWEALPTAQAYVISARDRQDKIDRIKQGDAPAQPLPVYVDPLSRSSQELPVFQDDQSPSQRDSARAPLGMTLAGLPVTRHVLPGEGVPSSRRATGSLPPGSGGAVGPRPAANFALRGAGALPTHRHTTRTSNVDPNVANVDWTDWANSVEAKLAKSKGSLQTGVPRMALRG